MTYQQMVKLQIEYRRPERELIRYVARGTTLVERERANQAFYVAQNRT